MQKNIRKVSENKENSCPKEKPPKPIKSAPPSSIELRKRQKTTESDDIDLNFDNLEEIYTLRPTEDEFKEFIPYVEKLYSQGVWKYGTIKVIPPQGFQPTNWFDKQQEKRFSTRFQWPYEMSQGLVSLHLITL